MFHANILTGTCCFGFFALVTGIAWNGWRKSVRVPERGLSRVKTESAANYFLLLANDVQQMITRRIISQGHGFSLLQLPDQVTQSRLAQAIVERDLSIKQTRALVNIWITQGREAVGIMLGMTEIWTRKATGHFYSTSGPDNRDI